MGLHAVSHAVQESLDRPRRRPSLKTTQSSGSLVRGSLPRTPPAREVTPTMADTKSSVRAVAPVLSIVIPAYNEGARLPESLKSIYIYLERKAVPWELLVVDDGSTDSTSTLVENLRASGFPDLRLLRNEANRGKGYSVRRGVLAARGELVLLTDADLSTPISQADKLLRALEAGYDIGIGSRAIDPQLTRFEQPPLRRLLAALFVLCTRLLLGLPYRDTQCGFKAFKRSRVLPLFRRQRIEGFGFDPEILFLAKREGLGCAEVGVLWHHDPDSRLRVWRDGLRMVLDLLRVRWYSLRGAYDIKTSYGEKKL